MEETTEEWAERYGIEPEMMKCRNCGKGHMTTVPIRIKGYAGLETPDHGCPKKFAAAVFTPIDKAEINFWNRIL